MRQNRQNERERGGVGEVGGIRVCDCQLWERDPPGGVKVQEERKKEQKRGKKNRAGQRRDGKKEEKKWGRMLF